MKNKMKIVGIDDMFFRNFRYLKQKSHISRQALAKLLDITVDKVKCIEETVGNVPVDARITERIAEIYAVDLTALLTVDLENPAPPPCGPNPL